MNKTLLSLVTCLLMGSVSAQVQVLTDTSLEASGAGNSGVWVSTSTNFGTTWCDVAGCGNGGGLMIPKSGSYYSWFGGTTNPEIGKITQTFNVTTAGTAELKFWWVMPLRNNNDIFKVKIDGVDVYSMDNSTAIFETYQEEIINLGNLSAGLHTIQFYSEKAATPDISNIGLDDITLNVTSVLATQDIGLSSGINIYTNSLDNTISISNKTLEKNAEIGIYEASGKLLSKKTYDISSTQIISTKGWNPGMYILNIKTEKEIISKKVLVK